MIPAQLPTTIKQNLNKAFQLVKPKAAAIERFKTNLFSLVSQQFQEQVKKDFATLLPGTYAELADEEPQNSSPVCYANVSGLRAGFEDPILTESETPSTQNNKTLPAGFRLPDKKLNPNLKEAVHLTISGISAILAARQTKPSSDETALKKQIHELVYQLYELTPDEIRMVEER